MEYAVRPVPDSPERDRERQRQGQGDRGGGRGREGDRLWSLQGVGPGRDRVGAEKQGAPLERREGDPAADEAWGTRPSPGDGAQKCRENPPLPSSPLPAPVSLLVVVSKRHLPLVPRPPAHVWSGPGAGNCMGLLSASHSRWSHRD